jgi:hypothetical protein
VDEAVIAKIRVEACAPAVMDTLSWLSYASTAAPLRIAGLRVAEWAR